MKEALLLIALQVVAFALVAFPVRTLAESFRVALAGRAGSVDAAGMAVGVFAALGRVSVVAGFNGAVVAVLYASVTLKHGGSFTPALTLGGLSIAYGYLFKGLIALPLERIAYARLESRPF